MRIAIHNSKKGFHPRWVAYCAENEIPYKFVNCYANDIIEQLEGCDALMWHHSQQNPKDLNIAKQILFALEHTGFRVFPDFRTGWHFDDKLGQKYLLERLELPLVTSYLFFDCVDALKWAEQTSYPKVFKLRGGAGSANVTLVKSKKQAKKLISSAFSTGLSNYNARQSFKDRWYKFKIGQASIKEPIKGLVRFFIHPPYAKALGKEYSYVYFQDFIPNLKFDYRVKFVNNRVWGYKRFVRQGDFRASGSGSADYEYGKNAVPEKLVSEAFKIAGKLKMQSIAFDFVTVESEFKLIEISGLFGQDELEFVGYWDKELNWHEGKFNPQGWMVDLVLEHK